MDALAATSDELRKYPMVTDNLAPFAGPQCFPHLDKASTECRLHANQRLKNVWKFVADELQRARLRLAWRCRLYRAQASRGAYFLHEHPFMFFFPFPI